MVCFHRRYNLGDEHDYNSSHYANWDELEAAVTEEEDSVVVLPLFLYDHSGITMACGDSHFRAFDSQCWDHGRVGLILARREDVLKEFGKKRISKKMLKKVEEILLQEVETYDQYLTGDVWGFIIEDDEGEHLESCWGFFGHDYCEQEAQQALEYLQKQPVDSVFTIQAEER